MSRRVWGWRRDVECYLNAHAAEVLREDRERANFVAAIANVILVELIVFGVEVIGGCCAGAEAVCFVQMKDRTPSTSVACE